MNPNTLRTVFVKAVIAGCFGTALMYFLTNVLELTLPWIAWGIIIALIGFIFGAPWRKAANQPKQER